MTIMNEKHYAYANTSSSSKNTAAFLVPSQSIKSSTMTIRKVKNNNSNMNSNMNSNLNMNNHMNMNMNNNSNNNNKNKRNTKNNYSLSLSQSQRNHQFLVPSQSINSGTKLHYQSSEESSSTPTSTSISFSTKVLSGSDDSNSDIGSSTSTSTSTSTNMNLDGNKQKKQNATTNTTNNNKNSITNNNNSHNQSHNNNYHNTQTSFKKYNQTKSAQTPQPYKYRYTGNLPDIFWRAIPMDHLRLHPSYQPLPHPSLITHVESIEDVRNFRQDSWQWDMLHSGRCTTSQAAPALGLLEPNAAKLLSIPRSLQKGCMGAYVRLSQSALRTLDEMNDVLCSSSSSSSSSSHTSNANDGDGDDNESNSGYDSYEVYDEESNKSAYSRHVGSYGHNHNHNHDHSDKNKRNKKQEIWSKMQKRRYPFAARYEPHVTEEDLAKRRVETQQYMKNLSSPMKIRMNWGNSQEATAILTALNYFYTVDPTVKIKEVGMCGAGLEYNSTRTSIDGDDNVSNLILGASPDAVIEYSNGTLEVLEVKNHCPFVPTRKYQNFDKNGKEIRNKKHTRRTSNDKYRIREMPMHASVPAAYIPQLMMEMMCLGDNCRSAVMCRQTATNGAILVRLRRDDEWINEMIFWLEKFLQDHVEKGIHPSQNFFWFDDDGNLSERYQKFVMRTKELSNEVELVQHVHHGSIQRVLGDRGVRLPLFLD